LLLDYNIINENLTNFTFQSDTTYYLSGTVNSYGTTILEGGTVIKCADGGEATTVVNGNVQCLTESYRPAIFTVTNDNSVGTALATNGSVPTLAISTFLSCPEGGSITNVRFSYAWNGLSGDGGDMEIADCQFVNCSHPITVNADTTTLGLHNVLITMDDSINNTTNFCGCDPGALTIYSQAIDIYGENITADLGSQDLMIYFMGVDDPSLTSVALTNSIIITPNLGAQYAFGGGPVGITPSTNFTFCASSLPTNLFQTVGAGSHYLANISFNPCHADGTTNISPGLIADLAQRTTWPPIVLSNITISTWTNLYPQAYRDNIYPFPPPPPGFGANNPDLGYHYTPIDFIVDDFAVTNAPLVLTNGVALACYADPAGIVLYDGSSIVSIGSPLNPNWFTTYQMVQEQSVTIGAGYGPPQYFDPYHYGNTGPNGTFQFCKFSGNGTFFYEADPWAFNNLLIEECEFYVGSFTMDGSTNSEATTVLDNNLFARAVPNIVVAAGASFAFSNNLVWCADFELRNFHSLGILNAYNNIFDTCSINIGSSTISSNGYNAYLNCGTNRLNPTNAFDIVSSNSLTYESGPLGYFYQSTNSPLINAGSTTANLVGLYYFTTQTNQVPETNSIVDLGYHYVALGTNGQPLSTYGGGVANYLLFPNGMFVTIQVPTNGAVVQ
jgi:hypothetical protein